jgi:magnesium transporter
VNCFQINDELELIPCDYETAVKAVQKQDTNIWIDIQGAERAELEENLDILKVQGLARRLCLEAHDRPGFYPMSNLTFMVLPVLAAGADFHAVEHVAFLVRKNLLLTLRDMRATALQRTINLQDSAEWLPDGSVAGLGAAFMIVLSLESLNRTSDLRETIMTLEQRMDSQPDSVEMKEISHKRSELLTLESVVSGQIPMLQALIDVDRKALKSEHIREYLICALANLQATDRSLGWLEGRIDVMRSMVDMQAQEKTNRRLGRLTIVSVIFLPMTFLAGLWGMNFKYMPGLKNPFGYPIALGSMFLLAVGIYFYFRRKGWLD